MPFHFLLTEAILCQGGSLELVKLFNRVGAAACIETNSRLATQVSYERIAHGFELDLINSTFNVVSIDNVDILQPHSFVSSTDTTRSWHGTSVQCIQPLPHTCTVSNKEIKDHPIRARKHPHSSPIASPIPVVKHKHQRRTLKELPSPHSALSIPENTTHPMLDETQAITCLM